MDIFNDILRKHASICTCRESYMINEDIEITVSQDNNKVVIWAFNHRSNRFVNLGTKRFKKLIDGFNEVCSDLYLKDNKYYITLINDCKVSVEEDHLSRIDFLEKEVSRLNKIIERLESEKLVKDPVVFNVRGAGRKAKFSDNEVSEIRELRLEGYSIKEIATRFNCSVGLVHKLINEN